MVTGNEYQGGNRIWLASQPFNDPRWLTFKQARDLGYKFHSGAEGVGVEFWAKENGRPVKVRTLTVFNAEQLIDAPSLATQSYKWDPVVLAENILKGSGATFELADRAAYTCQSDTVLLPSPSAFPSPEHYYGTALHELAHWTGHPSRLNRFHLEAGKVNQWAAREELRAELASFMISTATGIPHDPSSHAAYIAEWVRELRNDCNEIFKAAHDAETITNYLLKGFTK